VSEPVAASLLGRSRALGALGAFCVALGGLGGAFGVATAYFGLVLLVAAWWRLGRLASAERPPGPGALLATLAMWSAPLLVGAPLFSRDVYSYLAQGAMIGAGLDVYRYGPAVLGGPYAAEVPAMWQHSPAPYGPVALLLAAAGAAFAGANVAAGVLAMRAMAIAGVVLLFVMLPVLARRTGVAPAAALWLGAMNPLVVIHLVGGAHNDAVMLGLLAAGLAATAARYPAVGAVAVTAAALVKAPAAAGLVVVALLWAGQLAGRWRRIRAVAGTGALAAGSAAAITALAGTGFGWVETLRTPATTHNWSPVATLGNVTSAVTLWRVVGLAAVAATAVWVWRHRDRLGAVHALGLLLLAVVVFGPAIRPWYLLWAVVPLAAAAPWGRAGRWAAAGCAALALVILPDGFAPNAGEVWQAIGGGLLAVAALAATAAPARTVELAG
jgi:hypothetical protein